MVIISNESFGKQPGQNCQIELYFMKFGTSEYLLCSRLDNRVQFYYRDIKMTNRITAFGITLMRTTSKRTKFPVCSPYLYLALTPV